MRFNKPKNGHFNYYCFMCKNFIFRKQVGCAYIGSCKVKTGYRDIVDAYDPLCGLFESKGRLA